MAEKVKKPKSKARKIIEWVLFGLFGVAACFVLAANISAMIHKKENYGQSIRFGMGTFVILTTSMEPEIGKGTMIITMKEDVSEFNNRLQNGENIDITFANVDTKTGEFEPDSETFKHGTRVVTNQIMTHRLREVHINEEKEVGNGHYIFVASGINTQGEHSLEGQYQVFTEVQYLGTVRIVNSFLGKTMSFVSSPIGLIILLLIPAAYLITMSSIDIYKAVKESEEAGEVEVHNVDPTGDHLSAMSEEERQRLKNELLEEMLEEKRKGKK